MPTLLLLPAIALAARWGKPEVMGLVSDGAIDEISGLAAARRHPGMYWAHNDSGGGDTLHLIDPGGRRLASVATPDAPNIDWEDMASFRLDGRDYLLVADTGDNGGIRQSLVLHVFEEPQDLSRPASLAWSVRFRWPDGPRDCEAVAVDARRGEVLLISKKRVPAELFRVPLGATETEQVAELIGTLPGIEQPDQGDLRRSPTYGRYRSQITGADLSPNGRVLAVLNYRSVHFVVRDVDGDWSPGLADKLPHLTLPWLPQAEAIAFSLDGRSLTVASEQLPSPIIRFQVEEKRK
ncbi:hypothetical protein [Arenimonas alkanexedens]